MNLIGSHQAWPMFLLCLAVFCTSGCREQRSSRTALSEPGLPAAEASFRVIVDTFRRGVETRAGAGPTGFALDQAGTRSQFVINNTVSDELFSPETEDDPYRGTITVVSRSRYSVMIESDDEANRSDSKKAKSASPESFGGGDLGADVLDSDLVNLPTSAPKASRSTTNDTLVDPRSEEHTSSYELVYTDGKWKLETELDDMTEQSIRYAFQYALEKQP